MDYKQAIRFINDRRRDDLYRAEVLYARALESDRELYEADKALKKLTLDSAKGIKVDKNEIKRLEKERKALLAKAGLGDKALNPPPRCTSCGDTGLLPGGRICSCAKALAINSGRNVDIPLHAFPDADFSLSGDSATHNAEVYDTVKKIILKYPDNKRRNIVLLGGTGTGKTFLAGCAAALMAERGGSVTAVTAFDFVQRALSYHTTFDDRKQSFINPLLDSNLLIIDDLGTESIFRNITLEYLYTVLNERMYKGKLTMFTSNLSQDELLSRYGERIYSRLFDKALSYRCVLTGDDIRLKKR